MEPLKSYLVSLGFQVNNAEFNKMSQALTDMSKLVQSSTDGMMKSFAVASVGIAGVMMTATAAIAGMIDKVAQLDLEYQKLALHMYTSTEQAKQFKIVTDAMGENINDIAWVPELSQRYTALMQQAKQMGTPGDSEEGLKKVRDIRFEFTRMKVEIMYGLQWIEYYLIKYLGGPLTIIENKLKSVNDWLTKNMPVWTEKIAGWITMFIQFATSIGRFCVDIIDGVERAWASMGKGEKTILGLLAVFELFRLSPAVMVIAGLMILIDDFYAYIDGRKSSKTLAPIWGQLISWYKEIKPYMLEANDALENLSVTLTGLAEGSIKIVIDAIKLLYEHFNTITSAISKGIQQEGVWGHFKSTLKDINSLLNTLVNVLEIFMKDEKQLAGNPEYLTFWDKIGLVIAKITNNMLDFISTIMTAGKVLALLAVGDFKGAWGIVQQAATKDSGRAGAQFNFNKGNNGVGGTSGGDNQKTAMDFFTGLGYSKEFAAGIVGNLTAESNLNPAIDEVGGGPGHGIAQWGGGRKEGLYNFARGFGLDPDDLTTQLKYINYELQNGESGAMDKIQSSGATTPQEYALAFSKYYERPEWAENPERQQNAADAYSSYGGNSPAYQATNPNYSASNGGMSVPNSGNYTVNINNQMPPGANAHEYAEQTKNAVIYAIRITNAGVAVGGGG